MSEAGCLLIGHLCLGSSRSNFFFWEGGSYVRLQRCLPNSMDFFFLPWRKMMVAALLALDSRFMARLEVLCAEVPALPRRRGI